MSDLSHESREVLRLHTEALNKFTAELNDFAWKVEHGDLFYDLTDTVNEFQSAITELRIELRNEK